MKKKIGLVVILVSALAILGITGCSAVAAQTPSVSSNSPASSTASVPNISPVNLSVNNQQGIWVSGQGKVTVTPDIAKLNLGVTAQAAKVADAQSQASAAMNKVISALTADGVATKDISTQYYNISQMTRYDNTTQQSVVTGYQVSNFVNVTIRNIDNVGKIIDDVTAAGGDLIRVNSISFSVDNPDQYYAQARTLAMNDAKAKAEQLGSLAGVTLGRPIYIVENPTSTPTPYPLVLPAASASSEATTPISPGQTEITLNVQVAYAIQQ